jgi:DNA end-binding protein Ku
MALALVDQLTEPFIPEDFHDTYTEELEAAIEAKVKGKPVPTGGKAASSAPTQDLMAALKASLESAKQK